MYRTQSTTTLAWYSRRVRSRHVYKCLRSVISVCATRVMHTLSTESTDYRVCRLCTDYRLQSRQGKSTARTLKVQEHFSCSCLAETKHLHLGPEEEIDGALCYKADDQKYPLGISMFPKLKIRFGRIGGTSFNTAVRCCVLVAICEFDVNENMMVTVLQTLRMRRFTFCTPCITCSCTLS